MMHMLKLHGHLAVPSRWHLHHRKETQFSKVTSSDIVVMKFCFERFYFSLDRLLNSHHFVTQSIHPLIRYGSSTHKGILCCSVVLGSSPAAIVRPIVIIVINICILLMQVR